jgi:hypothetical protein
VKTESHDLAQLVQQAAAELAAEYRRIQSRILEDPGTGGDQAEENWTALLKNWLPAGFHVRTKGRIIRVNGLVSPQVDVLVLSPAYPLGLLDKKLYLAAGVVAAFECKATLRREHIRKAVKNSATLGVITRSGQGSPTHIIYGVLAHSHAIASKRSRPESVLSAAIDKITKDEIDDPRDCMDFVCVADLGTWTLMRILWTSDDPAVGGIVSTTYMGPLTDEGLSAASHGPTSDPVGRLLTSLFRRIAQTDPKISSLADYFHQTGLTGTGAGVLTQWPLQEVPDELRRIIW